ncbi:MAG TPA: ADP-ribosylglycohydrolase family protein [Steroidobacteraceae bacterium]|nr:ADP-ribosylglycohydrolase family protein [Steroidobacteraceae bacterium]
MSSSLPAPLSNSYWVLPGRLLAGEYPGALEHPVARERIERLLGAGIDCFLDLTAPEELPPYAEMLPPGIAYHRRPIRDHGVPTDSAQMTGILELIESALRSGRRAYVHCRAGVGRTATVIGCLLVERGLNGELALEELNRLWRHCARAEMWTWVPETDEQIEYVRGWMRRDVPEVGAGGVLQSRFLGALVGLAVGDALAAATEQLAPGTFSPARGLVGGGPYELPPGAWSDDTAMALCLADSLLSTRSFDARDQVDRYLRWREEGYLSATDRCVGLRDGVARALAVARWRRQLFPGSHEPRQLDPEPLSRVAPAVLFAFPDLEQGMRLAGDAARTTCQAPAVVEACRVLAAMLHVALCGGSKEEILAPPALAELDGSALRPRIRALLRGRYLGKRPDQIRSGTTTTEALEAALWALERTGSFEEGALLAVNLGGNSDVVGAVYGQLAGAHYTVAGIPPHWRAELSRLPLIESFAEQLFQVSARLD